MLSMKNFDKKIKISPNDKMLYSNEQIKIQSQIKKLLKDNYADGIYHTHVSMIVPCGKFQFNRMSEESFWNMYCDYVKNDFIPFGIAEKPQQYLPVLVDVDLKINSNKKPNVDNDDLYTQEQVKKVILIYQNILNEILEEPTNDKLTCVFLNKPPYKVTSNTTEYIKNGFHLHFPNCFLDKSDQEVHLLPRVRIEMQKQNIFSNLNISNDKIIDENVLNVPWLVYGSVKEEGKLPYLLSKIYDHNVDEISIGEAFNDYKIYDYRENLISVKDNAMHNLPKILSIRVSGRETQEIKRGIVPLEKLKKPLGKPLKKSSDYQKTSLHSDGNEDKRIAKFLMPMISDHRADDYKEWTTMCWVIHNIFKGSDEGLQLWLDFSSRNTEKYHEGESVKLYEQTQDENFTLGTLRYYASIDSPQLYETFKNDEKKQKKSSDDKQEEVLKYFTEISSEEHLANYFLSIKTIWYHQRMKKFYTYCEEDRLWKLTDRECIGAKIHDICYPYLKSTGEKIFSLNKNENDKDKENDNDKTESNNLKTLCKALSRLKTNAGQTAIQSIVIRKCQSNPRDDMIDINFDKSKGLFPLKDKKVIDLKTLIVRDRTKEDYFTKTSNNVFKAKESVNYQYVRQYFREVLNTNDEKYVDYLLSAIGYSLTGENNLKRFFQLLGVGNTGKSLFIHLLSEILSCFSNQAPDSIFKAKKTEAVHDQALFAIINYRAVTISELAEKESYNVKLMKAISGGDSMNIRRCGGDENISVQNTSVLWSASNEIPQYDNDKAFIERMRIISFNKVFPKDGKKKAELLSYKDDFFTVCCEMAKLYYDNNGFDDVKQVIDNTNLVVGEKDSFKNYLEDGFITDFKLTGISVIGTSGVEIPAKYNRVKKDSIYLSYQHWFSYSSEGSTLLGKKVFYKRFEDEFKGKIVENEKLYWKGIIRNNDEPDDEVVEKRRGPPL